MLSLTPECEEEDFLGVPRKTEKREQESGTDDGKEHLPLRTAEYGVEVGPKRGRRSLVFFSVLVMNDRVDKPSKSEYARQRNGNKNKSEPRVHDRYDSRRFSPNKI